MSASDWQSYAESLESICMNALPVVARNIESSNMQTEKSINELTHQFSQLAVRLSDVVEASRTRKDIMENEIDELVLKQSCNIVDKSIDSLESLIDYNNVVMGECKQAIESIIDRLKESVAVLQKDAMTLRKTDEDIRDEISNVIVSLQFQDRVSQILSQSATCLNGIADAVTEGRIQRDESNIIQPIDFQGIQEKMVDCYTTEEQRHNHDNADSHKGPGHDGSELTIF